MTYRDVMNDLFRATLEVRNVNQVLTTSAKMKPQRIQNLVGFILHVFRERRFVIRNSTEIKRSSGGLSVFFKYINLL